MIAWVLALAPSAYGLDLSSAAWGVSFGVETVTNDPLQNRHGIRLGVGWSPVEWVEAGFSATWYPILGRGGEDDPDWKPLLDVFTSHSGLLPDIPQLVGQGQLVVRVLPVRVPLGGGWDAGAGVLAGAGLFAERGGGTLLPPSFGPAAGVFWQVNTARAAIRVRYELDTYVGVGTSWPGTRRHLLLGAEVLCWF